MNVYLKSTVSSDDAVPGASFAVQTYGDFLKFNPHLHAIVSDGCFFDDGSFRIAPGFILEDLEEIFQYEVLKMLKKEDKGFHVYIGDRIIPSDKTGLGNLARYIIRACFSQERMIYVPDEESADGVTKVVYTSKDRKSRKVFSALDWLARLVTRVAIFRLLTVFSYSA